MDKGWGRAVSVVMGPIFHGKLNKANAICLCMEPSTLGHVTLRQSATVPLSLTPGHS